MNEESYKKIVKKYTPKENKIKNYIISFISGGIVGVIGELLIRFYMLLNFSNESATTLMIITVIFFSVMFTSLGFFDDLVRRFRSGLLTPITGFAHSIEVAFIDYKSEGWIKGIGGNAFHLAGSVIITGIVSSILLGIIRLVGAFI